MYIFPRQFGLHNAFTSAVNYNETTQKFRDYTSRKEEIDSLTTRNRHAKFQSRLPKLPKRLRGAAKHLVRRLQILHSRCSYTELLQYYCPSQAEGLTRAGKAVLSAKSSLPLVEYATPASQVSAFCQAVLSRIIPNKFWGDGDTMSHNKAVFLHKVDHFVKLRRFESMTLHEILQDLKACCLLYRLTGLVSSHLLSSYK